MAEAISNPQAFIRSLSAIRRRPQKRRPSLLAFFLFDERRSHQTVLEFARREFSWLDRLAATNHMILFFFLPEGEPAAYSESEEEILVAEGEVTVANPSLDIARRFGLRPSELPGIVFFTELDLTRPGPHDGVFWPLSVELFAGDAREAEATFSHVFDLVQEAHFEAPDPGTLLAVLRQKVDMEARDAPARPVLAAVRTETLKTVTFPGALMDATRLAFAHGLGA